MDKSVRASLYFCLGCLILVHAPLREDAAGVVYCLLGSWAMWGGWIVMRLNRPSPVPPTKSIAESGLDPAWQRRLGPGFSPRGAARALKVEWGIERLTLRGRFAPDKIKVTLHLRKGRN